MVKSCHLPAYYSFPLIAFIFITFMSCLKFYEMNTSKFYQTVTQGDIVGMEVILILDLLSVALVHKGMYYLLCSQNKKYLKNWYTSSIVINAPMAAYYIFIVIIAILDMSICAEMQMAVSVDYLKAYLFGVTKKFGEPYLQTGLKTSSGSGAVLAESVAHNVTHWAIFFTGLAVIIVPLIVFLILNFKLFISSLIRSRPDVFQRRYAQQAFSSSSIPNGNKNMVNKEIANDQSFTNEQADGDQNDNNQQGFDQINGNNHNDNNDNGNQTPAITNNRMNHPDVIQEKIVNDLDTDNYGKCFKAVNIKILQPNSLTATILTIFESVVLLICFILFCCYQASNNPSYHMNRYVPPHWVLYKSAQSPTMSEKRYLELVNNYRNNNPGFYLDNRPVPLYPLVKGTREQQCAYNYEMCTQAQFNFDQMVQNQIYGFDTQNSVKSIQNQEQIHSIFGGTQQTQNNVQKKTKSDSKSNTQIDPNVLFLIVESFSPSPSYFDQNFIDQAADKNNVSKVYEGQLYNETVLPNIAKFAKKSFAQAGTTSHGIPTIFGWLSLMTSEKPRLHGINMVSSVNNDAEAFARRFKNAGYYTFYQSPSPADFDGKVNWLFGRDWFDAVNYYVPNDKQKQLLLLDKVKKTSWLGDRLSSREYLLQTTLIYVKKGVITAEEGAKKFANFFNHTDDESIQLVKEYFENNMKLHNISENQPLMSFYMNVDTHTPFIGYDVKSIYTDNKEKTENDYAAMLNSADEYFGDILKYMEELDKNTIVVIVGDHGAREHPIFTKTGQHITGSTSFDKHCQFKSFGYDNMFTTSSVIGAFDEKLYDKYNIPKGVVINDFSDHDDLIYTLESMILREQQKPTSRNGVNLLSLYEVLKYSPEAIPDKLSVSNTHLYAEFRQKSTMFRGNLQASSHGILINSSSYPTCILPNTKMLEDFQRLQSSKDDLYKQGMEQLELTNYLSYKNRLYNYEFERATCSQVDGHVECVLPEKNNVKNFQTSNVSFIIVAYVVLFLCVCVVAIMVSVLVTKCANNRRIGKTQVIM